MSLDWASNQVPHRLQGKQVRDPKTDREGRLMAVMVEPLGYVEGGERHAETAYVRGADGREFTASADALVEVKSS